MLNWFELLTALHFSAIHHNNRAEQEPPTTTTTAASDALSLSLLNCFQMLDTYNLLIALLLASLERRRR